LENRSFDNVLGWLYEHEQPRNFLTADPSPEYDGLKESLFNTNRRGTKHFVARGTGNKDNVPEFDPHEEFAHVNYQLFETLATPVRATEPSMGGFFDDYATWYDRPAQIMMSFTPEELPVLNGLARNFAVSDRYFSSVPTQTNCNRAFAAAGNSLGLNDAGRLQAWVDNRNYSRLARPYGEQFNQRTLWNVLSEQGRNRPSDWMIFNSEGSWLANRLGAQGYPYTRIVMEKLRGRGFDAHFSTVGEPGTHDEHMLFGMIANGNLPAFSFVEPQWGLRRWPGFGFNGNDYHPPSRMRAGEHFLKGLYDALTANEDVWRKVLFIVNFDEHGGTYDHVPPPWTAVPPWADSDDTPEPAFLEGGFEFDRFGVRVPLILVSPWVAESTVFRADGDIPYDHTSVIATVLALMDIGEEHWKLGSRVAAAPAFDNVLTDQPRTDVPRVETNPAW
jgi:phospholipase C